MATQQVYDGGRISKKHITFNHIKSDFFKNKELYLLVLPVLAFYVLFCYKPMYGAIIAFKDYSPALGVGGSPWVGFKYFSDFFNSFYFWRVLKNTLVISLTSLFFGFPAPIILALMINELRNKYYARTVQTVTYLPHFVSLVVICGLITDFTMDSGIVNYIIGLFGGEKVSMLIYPKYFVPIYVISGIWQEVGWGSIIYLAALTAINPSLYEASKIDGAGRLKQLIYVTLPGIAPTITILLILRMGNLLGVGYEKIILLYNAATYETADVISTYVYRKGLQEFNLSFSTAVGLFNSVINFVFLISANWISKKTSETALW